MLRRKSCQKSYEGIREKKSSPIQHESTKTGQSYKTETKE
jgi:hypothetical protein